LFHFSFSLFLQTMSGGLTRLSVVVRVQTVVVSLEQLMTNSPVQTSNNVVVSHKLPFVSKVLCKRSHEAVSLFKKHEFILERSENASFTENQISCSILSLSFFDCSGIRGAFKPTHIGDAQINLDVLAFDVLMKQSEQKRKKQKTFVL
jgi:hypothetical protein